MAERPTVLNWSEKSAEAVVAASWERRAERGEVFKAMSMQQAKRQMSAQVGRVGVAHGEAERDPVSDEASSPRHQTKSAGSALLQVLQPILDPTFSEYSYDFRPGRRAPDAVLTA